MGKETFPLYFVVWEKKKQLKVLFNYTFNLNNVSVKAD